jgi:hypothetical protein
MTISTWTWHAKTYTESFDNEWQRHRGIFDDWEAIPDGIYEPGSLAAIDMATIKNTLRRLADKVEAEERRLVKSVPKAA